MTPRMGSKRCGRIRLSLAGSMAALAIVAVGTAALTSAYRGGIAWDNRGLLHPDNLRAHWWAQVWAGSVFATALLALAVATPCAVLRKGRSRRFWTGFALIGGGGLFFGFRQEWVDIPLPVSLTRLFPPPSPANPEGTVFFGPIFLEVAAGAVRLFDPSSAVPGRPYPLWVVPREAAQTALSLISLALALLGGLLCRGWGGPQADHPPNLALQRTRPAAARFLDSGLDSAGRSAELGR